MKFLTIVLTLLGVGAAFFFILRPSNALERINILVGTSPVSIWSWNTGDNTFIVIQLSSDLATDASGYGRYTLESLWKLGFIDKKGGLVLARALTDALAITTPWFIGQRGDGLVQVDDPIAYGRSMFSPKGIISLALRRRVTNMPFTTYISLVWALMRARSDAVSLIDLVARSTVASESLPDGTVRQFIDPERVDVLTKGRFEDISIRSENITVGVYNTTSMPALGTQAARMLANLGVLVVVVGNSEPELTKCSLEGISSVIQSKTARMVRELFNCNLTEVQHQQRADLIVRLGTSHVPSVLDR